MLFVIAALRLFFCGFLLFLYLACRCRVLGIIYLHPGTQRIAHIYRQGFLPRGLPASFRTTLQRSITLGIEDGYLVFLVWNPWTRRTEIYCLCSAYAQVVFGISSPYNLWVLSDTSLVFSLHMLQQAMGMSMGTGTGTGSICQLWLGNEDVSGIFRPLMASLSLRQNLRAEVLPLLYTCLTGKPWRGSSTTVRMLTCGLEGRTCIGDDYLVP